jgi:transcriptional regulator with XRE-family HTH domain
MNNQEIGILIRKYRLAHKLSQADFAAIFKVSQPTVASWETGLSGPAGTKRDDLLKLVYSKDLGLINESDRLNEIIQYQHYIIDLLYDKIISLGGNVKIPPLKQKNDF